MNPGLNPGFGVLRCGLRADFECGRPLLNYEVCSKPKIPTNTKFDPFFALTKVVFY
jgi:hypothetical protein